MDDLERANLFTAARAVLLDMLPDLLAIYVYGSFARGDEWPNSDLDLAVLLPPGRRLEELLSLTAQVAERVGREVDLVDLNEAGDILRGEILAKGRLLYAAQPEQHLAWEASAMSRYAEHRTAIRGILEDFTQTGIGYAGR